MPILRALMIAPLMCLALHAQAENPAVSEQALKAVLFYKLPLFVYSGAGDKRYPINICTLGEAPLGDAASKLPSTLADGRRVELRTLSTTTDVDDCQYVFIGRSEGVRLDSLLRRLSGRRVVTVSDIEGFAMAGGMVEFSLRGDASGLLILINRKAAQKQGIEFNAQLLRLAKIVEP
jgi:hypothetical protein